MQHQRRQQHDGDAACTGRAAGGRKAADGGGAGKGHGKRTHKPANAAGAGKADGRSAMRCDAMRAPRPVAVRAAGGADG